MVVNTETLKDNPDFGKALVGAWYETMAHHDGQATRRRRPRATAMAKASGTDLAGFDAQLATTRCSTSRRTRSRSRRARSWSQTMDHVRNFCFEHGLLGAERDVDASASPSRAARSLGDADERQAALRSDAT